MVAIAGESYLGFSSGSGISRNQLSLLRRQRYHNLLAIGSTIGGLAILAETLRKWRYRRSGLALSSEIYINGGLRKAAL
jgi:hypothetical protein